MSFAALPMYDRPENAAAHDALWALIRDGLWARGVEAPDALDRGVGPAEGWGRPDLVLGQICNLPWRARFRASVTIIGAADHGITEDPGHYVSLIVARADDPSPGPRLAVNDPLSNSGWDMPQEWARVEGVPLRPVVLTGSHAASLRAVIEGRADLAGIDAVTFRGMLRWDAAAARVRVVGRTRPTPGMTFITAMGRDPAPIREALAEAIDALPEAARDDLLGLAGLAVLPLSDYERPLPPPPVLAA